MAQKNKFDDFEKARVVSLLEILFPNSAIPLREGNVNISEPDAIIQIEGKEIGVEVRRFSESNTFQRESENVQRESAQKRIQEHLTNSLSKLPSTVIVQIDGNKIPIDNKKSKAFMLKAEKELLNVIPELLQDKKIEIEGISISILQSNNKSLNVTFLQSHDPKTISYSDAVINAFDEKNTKTYKTEATWLLLYERTNLPYWHADFEKITNYFKSKPNQFQAIYILNSWKTAGIIDPEAFQIWPIFKPLFRNLPTP